MSDLDRVLALASVAGYERMGQHGEIDVHGYQREWFRTPEGGDFGGGIRERAEAAHNFMNEENHAEVMSHHVSHGWFQRHLHDSSLHPSSNYLASLRNGRHDYPLVDMTSHHGAVADLQHLGHSPDVAMAAVRDARARAHGGPATFQDARGRAEQMTASARETGGRVRRGARQLRERLISSPEPSGIPVRVRA